MNQFWNNRAKSYTKNTDRIFGDANKRIINITKRYCRSDMQVLDIGCGTGLIIKDIAPFVNKVIAIDTSTEMIREAKRNVISNIVWRVCDISQIETEKSFNMITAFNVLRYIENVEEFLHRIYDMLPPGGYFISVTDCVRKDKSLFSYMEGVGMKIGYLPYMRDWKMPELKEYILSFGFEDIYDENVFTKSLNYLIIVRKPL